MAILDSIGLEWDLDQMTGRAFFALLYNAQKSLRDEFLNGSDNDDYWDIKGHFELFAALTATDPAAKARASKIRQKLRAHGSR